MAIRRGRSVDYYVFGRGQRRWGWRGGLEGRGIGKGANFKIDQRLEKVENVKFSEGVPGV